MVLIPTGVARLLVIAAVAVIALEIAGVPVIADAIGWIESLARDLIWDRVTGWWGELW